MRRVSEGYVEPEVLRPRTRTWQAYLLLAPAFAVLALFFVWPLLWLFPVSTQQYDPVTATSHGVGLSFYYEVLASPAAWRAILNMAFFSVVYIPLTLVIAGALALLLHRRSGTSAAFRAIFCAPYMIPAVGAALIWRAAYMRGTGSIDRILYLLGYDHGPGWAGWLGEPYLATPCIALLCVWRDAGLFALILLAARARVPKPCYELAHVDGASPWQTLTSVTIPSCLGTISLCLVLLLLNVGSVFQEIFVLTGDGGPANWSMNVPFLVYRRAYVDYDWGHAAALSVIFLTVAVVLILIQNRMIKRRLGWQS